MGCSDDMDVEWCFARLEFGSIGDPDAFRGDARSCLLSNLYAGISSILDPHFFYPEMQNE